MESMEYMLSGNEKHLNLRAFDESIKKESIMKHKVEFVQIKIVFKIGKIRNRTNGNRSYSALE